MNTPIFIHAVCLTFLLVSTGCQTGGGGEGSSRQVMSGSADRLSREELAVLIRGFADDYAETVAQALDEIADADIPPRMRQMTIRRKLFPIRAVYRIAVTPDPELGFVDMVVHTSLEHEVLKRGYAKELFGERAALLLEAYEILYARIWGLAERAMSPAQVRDLKGMVAQWLADHPNQRYVADIRFHEFTRGSTDNFLSFRGLGRAVSTLGGLSPLTPVQGAAAQAELIRQLSDRINYTVNRFPLLLQWQIELTVASVLGSPEVGDALARVDRLSEAADQLGRTVKSMPDVLRESEGSWGRITRDLVAAQEESRRLLGDFRETVWVGGQLMADVKDVAAEAAGITRDVAMVIDRLNTPPRHPATTEVDKYAQAFETLAMASRELGLAVDQVQRLIESEGMRSAVGAADAAAASRLEQAGGISRELIDHLALRAVQAGGLIVVFAVAGVLIVRAVRGKRAYR